MTGVQTCALPICFPVTIGAQKAKQGGHKGNQGVAGGSKVQGGQRSGGAPQVQRKAGPSGSGAAG